MKDHTNLPLSISELNRILGEEAVEEILDGKGEPGQYAGGIAMPHVLRQMLVAWVKQGRPDPVNNETDQTSHYVLESREKWRDAEKSKRLLLEAYEQASEHEKELVKLREQVTEMEEVRRDKRLTDLLYNEKRKQYAEQKRMANLYNSRLILYRGRYGSRFMGELNWFQRLIARLFFITGRIKD